MRLPPPANPPTGGQQSVPATNRKFETFSRGHREQLALGVGSKDRKPTKGRARITVTVRKRPLTSQEINNKEQDIISVTNKRQVRVNEPRKTVTGQPYVEGHDFEFDRVYDENCTNQEVYTSCVKNLVDAIFEHGGRCSCFAFGQTGSGKTYTMVGPKKLRSQKEVPQDQRGLWEWAAIDLIHWIQKPKWHDFGLYCSFFEIYCNKVYDLLGGRKLVRALETRTVDGVVVKDLSVLQADSVSAMLKLIDQGLAERVVGKNSRNSDSSRGHAIFTIELKHVEQQISHGKLAFIDLAGSERGADSMQSGRTTQTDGAGINRSLLALKECIRAMDSGNSHVPFRDSELTKVLRDMFITDTALTLMIANVAPTDSCCEQTLNTMRYADRVYQMRQNCSPLINEPDEEEDSNESLCKSLDERSLYGADYVESKHTDGSQDPTRTEEGGVTSSASSRSMTDEDPAPAMRYDSQLMEAQSGSLQDDVRPSTSPLSRHTSNRSLTKARIKYQTTNRNPTALLGTSRLTGAHRNSAQTFEEEKSNDGSGPDDYGTSRRHASVVPHSSRLTAAPLLNTAAAVTVSRNSLMRAANALTNSPRQSRTTKTMDAPMAEVAQSMVVSKDRRLDRKPKSSRSKFTTDSISKSAGPVVKSDSAKYTKTHKTHTTTRVTTIKKHPDSAELAPASNDLVGSPSTTRPQAYQRDVRRMSSSSQNSSNGSEAPVLDEELNHVEEFFDAGDDTASSSLYSPDDRTAIKQDSRIRPNKSPNKEETRIRPGIKTRAPLVDVPLPLEANCTDEVKRVFIEQIPSDVLTKIRGLLTTPASSPDNKALDDEDEDALRKRLATSQSRVWEDYSALLETHHAIIKADAALTLYHVRLAREFDNILPTRAAENGASATPSAGEKAVELTPERLKRIRDLLERKIYNLMSAGQALERVESAMGACSRLERELQRRSLQSVQFYSSVAPEGSKPTEKRRGKTRSVNPQ
eukprot:Blabericola_migrator_1__5506@NODE_280_length_10436_cov_136_209085_g230_i0_p2_GENE_NODE_280_length_10436_cov_136_209085_g230_i0NODE_280_length_10436_cov_136_209085_g230_i0_p2_ORF_typecomplete_len977_score206_87Kinesin/PF00225_23/6_1e82Microtub_bd/PF16796_5/2_9e15DUF87/PF01935_17/0_38DUF87/PF01935_17/2_2e03_NODE_280_length_10436_cov_136_209085_g230_i016674597